MALPFEGSPDEVKAHLDNVVGTPADLLTNLNTFLTNLGFNTGSVEDKTKEWLVDRTGASATLTTEDLLRVYLTGLGHILGTLADDIRASAIAGDLLSLGGDGSVVLNPDASDALNPDASDMVNPS